MTTANLLTNAIEAAETRRHQNQLRRMATAMCQHFGIQPYESGIAPYLGNGTAKRNDFAIYLWLVEEFRDPNGCYGMTFERCADALQQELNRQLPPHLLGGV